MTIKEYEDRDKVLKEIFNNTINTSLAIVNPLVLPFAIMNFVNNGTFINGIVLALIAGGAIYYPTKAIKNAIKNRNMKELNINLENIEEVKDDAPIIDLTDEEVIDLSYINYNEKSYEPNYEIIEDYKIEEGPVLRKTLR